MKQLIKRNPDFENFVEEFFGLPLLREFSLNESLSKPLANLKENENEFKIELSAPGFKKDQFNIEIDGDILSISSKNESKKEEKSDKYFRREFSSTSFKRSFQLPENTSTENISASYNDGVLEVSIPKAKVEAKKLKSVEVK